MASLNKELLDNNDQYQDFKIVKEKKHWYIYRGRWLTLSNIFLSDHMPIYFNKLGCACHAKKIKYKGDKIFY